MGLTHQSCWQLHDPQASTNDCNYNKPSYYSGKPKHESLCKDKHSSLDPKLPKQSRLASQSSQSIWMNDLLCNEVVETPMPVMDEAAVAADAVGACTLMSKKSAVARPRARPDVERLVKPKSNAEHTTSQAWNCGRLPWPWEVFELRSFLESRYGSLVQATHHIVDGDGTLDFAMFGSRLESL